MFYTQKCEFFAPALANQALMPASWA